MPNARNVEAPVTLLGPGRSGSTLITALFRKHPDFQAVGESASLVWSSFYWQTRWLSNTGRFPGGRDMDEVARDGVHGLLCSTYPSANRRWFHKPIFEPDIAPIFERVAGRVVAFEDPEEYRAWYWRVSRLIFPEGRFFTVLRDPAENAASIMQRWRNGEERAFARLRSVYELMAHPDSRLGLVIPFEQLQQQPEEAVRRILDFAGAPFDASLMSVFEQEHAPNASDRERASVQTPKAVQDLYDELLARAALESVRGLRG